MDAQQQLFGLMAVAEEQQKAVKTAIDGLTAERVALAKERAALTRAVAEAVPAMQAAAGGAADAAMTKALSGASQVAANAVTQALRPTIDSLSGVVQAASSAEESLVSASAWFAWKWVGVVAAGLLVISAGFYAFMWWEMSQLDDLRAEITQDQATIADLAKRGGKLRINTCGCQQQVKYGPKPAV